MRVVEDPYWHMVDEWEQADTLRSISQIGGKAIRIYTFSIKKKSDKQETERHIYAPKDFDEEIFRKLDKLLELCNKFDTGITIPFIDRCSW